MGEAGNDVQLVSDDLGPAAEVSRTGMGLLHPCARRERRSGASRILRVPLIRWYCSRRGFFLCAGCFSHTAGTSGITILTIGCPQIHVLGSSAEGSPSPNSEPLKSCCCLASDRSIRKGWQANLGTVPTYIACVRLFKRAETYQVPTV